MSNTTRLAASLQTLIPTIGEILSRSGAPSVAAAVAVNGKTIFEASLGQLVVDGTSDDQGRSGLARSAGLSTDSAGLFQDIDDQVS